MLGAFWQKVRGAKYRLELRRVFELHDLAQQPPCQEAYFYDFTTKLTESPLRLKHFRDIECELKGLDNVAWQHLKIKVAPLTKKKSTKRGWQGLFDELNEAKGYNHLVKLGCKALRFLEKSEQKTPDLQGYRGTEEVLCEVKTINMSDVEAERRANGDVITVQLELSEQFLRTKLKSDIEKAGTQLRAFSGDRATTKIVYIIVNFDDNLHEYSDEYEAQIRLFVEGLGNSDISTAFDIKPRFYSATRV